MKKYPTYKEPGIHGIGEIPEHWDVKKLKYLLNKNEGIKIGPFGSALKLEDMVESGIKVFGQENIIKNDFTLGSRFISDNKYVQMKQYTALPGDILITMMGTTGKSKVCPLNIEVGIIDSHLIRMRVNDIVSNHFTSLVVNNSAYIKHQIDLNSVGSIMSGLNSKIIKSLNIIIPSLEEQTIILSFLDQKTSEIDQLIAAKEELIQKLEAQRKAIINEAVTGQAFKTGMIPTPDGKQLMYKDSGVKWLGEIPEHWSVQKFRYSISVLTDYTANGSFASLAENVEYLESGYSRLVRLTDLRLNLENDGIYVSEKSHRFLKKSELYGKEILLANVGAYSGLAWKVPQINFPATLGPNMFLLKFKESLSNDFAYYSLVSDYLSTQLKNKAISSAQPKLNKEDVRSCIIVKPPFEEQRIIVQFLFEKFKEYNLLIEIENQSISKLKDYKQSLISEAVTGKIDVREWQKDEINMNKNL